MKKLKTIYLLLILIGGVSMTSCSKDDYEPNKEHEHEEVSILELKFKGNDIEKSIMFEQKEGDTTQNIPQINLPAGVYKVEIFLRNKAGVDMSNEIFEEAKDDHFIYFEKLGDNQPIIEYADDDVVDKDNIRIGKRTKWTLKEGESDVVLYLIHEPIRKNPELPLIAVGNVFDIVVNYKLTISK